MRKSFKFLSVILAVVMLVAMVPAGVASSDEAPGWRLADPANITIGKSYLIVSEFGAMVNEVAIISTPGDVTGDTATGLAVKPVTLADGKIVGGVTADMIWQFGPGTNTAAASGGLGTGAGYALLNGAPGTGGDVYPLRRESSFNAQHAEIKTNNPALLAPATHPQQGTIIIRQYRLTAGKCLRGSSNLKQVAKGQMESRLLQK